MEPNEKQNGPAPVTQTTSQPDIKREFNTITPGPELLAAENKPETNTPRVTEVKSTPREHQRPDLEVGVMPPRDQSVVDRLKAQQEAAQQ